MSTRLAHAFASLLLSLLACVSGSAVAQVTASAVYNNLRYTLADRDPNDGITPSATFELVEVNGTATVFDSKGTTLDECTLTSMGSCTASTPNGRATVWFDGNSSGARGEWSEVAFGGAYMTTRAVFSYSITPHTDFSFILDTSIHENISEGSEGGGYIFFFFNSEEGWFRAIDEDREGDRINPVLVQTGDEPVRGEVRAYTDVAARHVPPPVPEPTTWRMWSAGLFLFLGIRACVNLWPGAPDARDSARPAP